MKIATWNINSVRLRLPIIRTFLQTYQPDILALQETKVQDEHFPTGALQDMGYAHLYFSGEKSYNGVAFISKVPLSNVQMLPLVNDHRRHISATLPDGTALHNFYIPAGGDEPDIKLNPKFAHKLDYVDAMGEYFKRVSGIGNRVSAKAPIPTPETRNPHTPSSKTIILGDFNIAPYEHDVWSHKQLLKVVSHTPIEVEKLMALKATQDWVDVLREFIPPQEKLYSWWSYRNRNWKKSDRGRRLDHIWVTPALKPALKSGLIFRQARDYDTPSDHVPVMVELAL